MKVDTLIQVCVYLVDGEAEWYATCTVCRPTSTAGLIALHACIAAEVAQHIAQHCEDRFATVCLYTEWFTVECKTQGMIWRDLYWERQHPKGIYPPVLSWEYDGICPEPNYILPRESKNGQG